MADTFLRYLVILSELPRAPRRLDTRGLASHLERRGIRVTRRTLQRDLERLSRVLPVVRDDSTKPFGWAWSDSSPAFPVDTLARKD